MGLKIMFDNELAGKIITGLITAVVTLIVCIINNYTTIKRDRIARDEAVKKQINDIRADFMAHMEEILAAQQEIVSDLTLLKYKFDELGKKVEKHNNVVERMYSVENKISVIEEKQSVSNHRIDDLERKNEKENK